MPVPAPLRLVLIAPALDGPVSGGTLYNRALTAALRKAGVAVDTRTLEDLPSSSQLNDELVLLDSLYLDHFADLQERVPADRLRVLLHYLPSLVRLGRIVAPAKLSASEGYALGTASGFVVTSRFMQQLLLAYGLQPQQLVCVEPGNAQITRATQHDGAILRALMLANVVEGKGVLPLLRALSFQLQEGDALALEVAGSLDAEPAYAAACRELIASHPMLRARLQLLGPLAHEHALERLTRAQVLVSASHMESYGMALAEARAAGVPIIALDGGNACMHAEPTAGGVLGVTREQVAAELLALVRDRTLLATRDRLARAAIRTRSWDDAATELIAGLQLAQRSIEPA